MKKVAIVGAGRVGESTALNLVREELCDELVLLDVIEGMPQGVALDIQQGAPLYGFDTRVSGSNDTRAVEESDLVIVTAGYPRKPGMSRSDMLDVNVPIIEGIVYYVSKFAPKAFLLIVTNPVDVLTYMAWKRTGWERSRVFGLSGVLDATRMASFIALETGFSVKDISAMVLGGHGDAMVPLPRYTTISGIPISQFLNTEAIARIVQGTRKAGGEILALKKSSSAYDSPAASIAAMVDAVGHNRKRVLPCVSILDGEYGQRDIAMGIPALLGKVGLQEVIELPLSEEEAAQFKKSADLIRTDLVRLPHAAKATVG